MSEPINSLSIRPWSNRVILAAMYLFFAATIVRTLSDIDNHNLVLWNLGFEAAFIILYTLVVWKPRAHPGLLHMVFITQSVIILTMLVITPLEDFQNILFVLLSYQVAVVFKGRIRLLWAGILVTLTCLSLIITQGVLEGLALSLLNMAGEVVIVAYTIVNQEIEMARNQGQVILAELEDAHQKLETSAAQVEELAAIEERNRLARELHDSVSQTMFSIVLNTRTTQILLQRKSDRVRSQLEQLQALAQDALVQMRSLITRLRPKE